MSKIQEALRRIQSERPAPSRDTATDADDTVQVATLAQREDTINQRVDVSTNEMTLHVDQQALRDAGLIAPEYHVRLLANQYRKIKRPLIRHAFGKRATKVEDGNLIMVTSAVAGEGKTFTSINLALSMAQERDHSVILVDADVAKPHVSDIFGVADQPGLLDLIEDRSLDMKSVIMSTDVEGLSILPAGRPRAHATELLASSRMEKLTRALSTVTHEPIVIFDTPPLLQTSESSVLASLAGQIVVVVRANDTSHEALRQAMNLVGSDRAVNLVLNRAQDAGNDYQYGYGYGYGSSRGRELDRSGAHSHADYEDSPELAAEKENE